MELMHSRGVPPKVYTGSDRCLRVMRKQFRLAQLEIVLKSSCSRLSGSFDLTFLKRDVSTAHCTRREDSWRPRSLAYRANNRGPSTNPYGSPERTGSQLEVAALKTTRCLRLGLINSSSFCMSVLWHIVSNARLKSGEMTSTAGTLASKDCLHSVLADIRAVVHDLQGMKPCWLSDIRLLFMQQ